MPTTLDFVYAAPEDSVLAWYFRGFERARRVDELTELRAEELAEVVVTIDQRVRPADSPGADYVGQAFPLERRWTPQALECRLWEGDCRPAVRWFLFRDEPPLPEAELLATLWRRVDPETSER